MPSRISTDDSAVTVVVIFINEELEIARRTMQAIAKNRLSQLQTVAGLL